MARSASTCPSKEAVCSVGGICPPNPLTRMPFLPTASSGASWHDFVERLREDIEALVTQAYQQDEAEEAALGSRRGDALPAELARRADRLATIEAAMQRLEAQAKVEADAERPRRAAAEAGRDRAGTQRPGEAAKPVGETPP